MYDRKVQEIKDKQEDILEQRKLHSKADKGFYIMASRILELANKSAELFESSEREQKRQLLQFVLQNCQLRGKNIDFTLKKPFDAILLANKSQDWLRTLNFEKDLRSGGQKGRGLGGKEFLPALASCPVASRKSGIASGVPPPPNFVPTKLVRRLKTFKTLFYFKL